MNRSAANAKMEFMMEMICVLRNVVWPDLLENKRDNNGFKWKRGLVLIFGKEEKYVSWF